MEQSSMSDIVNRIKTRRNELGLSFQDLANLTSMSKSTLQRYETGAIRNLPLDKLAVLATALQTTSEWIMGWEEQKQPLLELEEGAVQKLNALMEMVDMLTPSEWDKLMDYASLIISARPNRAGGQ